MDNFIEEGDGDRGYWWCWVCHTCGEIGKAANPRARDDQKRVHTALGMNNLIDHPVDMKERKLVTDPTIEAYTAVTVCEHPNCDIETHAIPAPAGTPRLELLSKLPEPARRAMALEHELLTTRDMHKQTVEALNKQHENAARDFRKHVAQVAMRYARENDWCGTVEDALEEIGVNIAEGAKWVTVQFSLYVDVDNLTLPAGNDPEGWNDGGHISGRRYTRRLMLTRLEDVHADPVPAALELDATAVGARIHDWTPLQVIAVRDTMPDTPDGQPT